MIDSYDFGSITIDGKSYSTDVIVFPDRVQDGWWRKEGHRLSIEDLNDITLFRPEMLVVGTGYYGLMMVPGEVREYLNSKNVELIVEKTTEACKTYNRLVSAKKIVGAFHLTC